ncbi:MAG: phosphoribosyl-AMP cyclohydrolase [Thiotrichales bacterium]|jgi:phosphoribosyl-AMP cyclohydrolase|nr:phosphoribosyl-AMP cyclohydrolase [Thiotrichales bacterium]MBT5499344.1 phosphoribosyl-AMP cyclohydrolase [Thiotrichales bacterium]MBT5984489.1 phosphoribosyl-AMP cyclohydrolase [Thiotrichales bacterium]MBT6771918.1 phosphoribosyl-AMP cyclohydrolase [Thiotrichales bacterium]MBT7150028.1 phosphoribosyl-AMP cyclohydrolase [Thiotrichales bacterium]
MKPHDTIQFNEKGLVPVITQDYSTNEILMMAWMNDEALSLSIKTNKAVYFSRSRKKLWFKGEESGNYQDIVEIYTDCDQDVILLKVNQKGGIACHTGRANCFFNKLENNQWKSVSDVIKDPKEIYG